MERTSYIPTLNGWRAVAILLVIGAHSVPMLRNEGSRTSDIAASILSHGGIGVDIFFAISGYLICTLLLREKELSRIDLLAFYIRRFFRIVPPIAVYLMVLAILTATAVVSVRPKELLASLLFVRNYSDGSWYTGHFWSLAIEEHFYLFVPFVLSAFAWKESLRIAVAVVICCALIRFCEYLWLPLPNIEFRTEARIDAIMYGAITALLVFRNGSALKRMANGAVVISLLGGVLLLCYFIPTMPFRRTIMAIVMPVPIIYTVLHPESLVGGILEFNLLQWIGKISYSLYIWQMLFLVPGDRDMPLLQSFPVAFVLIFFAASASYFLIERPLIRLGRRVNYKPESSDLPD